MIPLKCVDDFLITFDTFPEDRSMREHFINECGWTVKDYNKILNYAWFGVKISAWKDMRELGTSYLGGCCYKSVEDCIKEDISGYLPQMIEEAIEEAKANFTK